MTWLWIVVAWLVTLGIAFLWGMFTERSRWTDIVAIDEKVEGEAKKKAKEKEDEIKNTDPHDTDKYLTDDTNEHILGVVDAEAEHALSALEQLSERNRERRDSGG